MTGDSRDIFISIGFVLLAVLAAYMQYNRHLRTKRGSAEWTEDQVGGACLINLVLLLIGGIALMASWDIVGSVLLVAGIPGAIILTFRYLNLVFRG